MNEVDILYSLPDGRFVPICNGSQWSDSPISSPGRIEAPANRRKQQLYYHHEKASGLSLAN